MRIIGLTGGIACGKSTVTSHLTHLDIPFVDCDLIARKVVAQGTPALAEIEKLFGSSVILENGELNRKQLGNIIFNDKSQNKVLGGIMGPAIQKQIIWEIIIAFIKGKQLVFIDAPTLYETSSLVSMCGEIVVVAVDEDVQLERLMARDQSTREEATARITSQLPLEKKIHHPSTTEVLYNHGDVKDLNRAVENMVSRLQGRAGVLHHVLTLPGILLLLGVGVLGYSRL